MQQQVRRMKAGLVRPRQKQSEKNRKPLVIDVAGARDAMNICLVEAGRNDPAAGGVRDG